MGSRRLRSIASRLTRRLCEERLDDFFQVGPLAFRAVYLLRLVFLDGQRFAKFFMALAADVFVKGHSLVWLVVEGSVSFDQTIFLTELSQIFAGWNFFSRRLSEAESEKRAFGVCDNLPRRQDGVVVEKVPGVFLKTHRIFKDGKHHIYYSLCEILR